MAGDAMSVCVLWVCGRVGVVCVCGRREGGQEAVIRHQALTLHEGMDDGIGVTQEIDLPGLSAQTTSNHK